MRRRDGLRMGATTRFSGRFLPSARHELEDSMKNTLATIAMIAATGIAGIAYAQTTQPAQPGTALPGCAGCVVWA